MEKARAEAVEVVDTEKEAKLKKIGLCLVGLSILVIGYKIGYKRSSDLTNKGMAIVFKENPGLKEAFADGLFNSCKNKMLRDMK